MPAPAPVSVPGLPELSYSQLSVELVRALRGRRSQTALSRRLGYRSNIVHRWENAACAPTAARFLQACITLGLDVAGSFTRFYGRAPEWLDGSSPATPSTVAAFLGDLRGRTPIVDLARAAGVNRYTVSRWLSGRAQPRLPEYLQMIEVSSRRLVDYLATLFDVTRLPSVSERAARLAAARDAAFGEPWSHAVLRALETAPFTHESRDVDALAQRLGIDADTLGRALKTLMRSGQVRRRGGTFVATGALAVDTHSDPDRSRQLKAHWSGVARQRLVSQHPGLYGYSLFAVSRHDLARIRALQLEFVRAMQSIIAASDQPECVGLYSSALLDLDTGADNALVGRPGT